MEKNSTESNNPKINLPSCACKGIRTCVICELIKNKTYPSYDKVINLTDLLKIKKEIVNQNKNASGVDNSEIKFNKYSISYYYLDSSLPPDYSDFNSALIESFESAISKLKNEINFSKNKINISAHTSESLFEGFYVIENFLSSKEETLVINEINSVYWKESQSGRKKQDFGPKINYKKRKVKYEGSEDEIFSQIPENLRDFVFHKLPSIQNIDSTLNLNDLKVAGVGNLFYSDKSGSHIEPHIDDFWVWGPRIIGINLLSDTVLTFSYEVLLDTSKILFELNVPIYKQNIYIMSGKARYIWKHSIKKDNILSDRIAVTIRELEQEYKEKFKKSKIINKI